MDRSRCALQTLPLLPIAKFRGLMFGKVGESCRMPHQSVQGGPEETPPPQTRRELSQWNREIGRPRGLIDMDLPHRVHPY